MARAAESAASVDAGRLALRPAAQATVNEDFRNSRRDESPIAHLGKTQRQRHKAAGRKPQQEDGDIKSPLQLV
jgi:hypothetical protein